MKCREPNIKYEKGMDRTEAEEKREKRKQEPILAIRFAGTHGRTNERTYGHTLLERFDVPSKTQNGKEERNGEGRIKR